MTYYSHLVSLVPWNPCAIFFLCNLLFWSSFFTLFSTKLFIVMLINLSCFCSWCSLIKPCTQDDKKLLTWELLLVPTNIMSLSIDVIAEVVLDLCQEVGFCPRIPSASILFSMRDGRRYSLPLVWDSLICHTNISTGLQHKNDRMIV